MLNSPLNSVNVFLDLLFQIWGDDGRKADSSPKLSLSPETSREFLLPELGVYDITQRCMQVTWHCQDRECREDMMDWACGTDGGHNKCVILVGKFPGVVACRRYL